MILATLCYVKHDGCTLMVYRNKMNQTVKLANLIKASQSNLVLLESKERLARGGLVYALARWLGRDCSLLIFERCC
jgi:hypothetical protein